MYSSEYIPLNSSVHVTKYLITYSINGTKSTRGKEPSQHRINSGASGTRIDLSPRS